MFRGAGLQGTGMSCLRVMGSPGVLGSVSGLGFGGVLGLRVCRLS